MKNTLLLGLALSSFTAFAAEEFVPLDMKLGYWETTSEIGESDMVKNMLANLPEAQREQVRAMMKSQIKTQIVKQCITKESLQNMEQQMKDSFGKENQCDFTVTSSTRREFIGNLNCGDNITTIHTKVINPKRNESDVVSEMGGMGSTKLRTIAEWKSDTCPAGV